jgi:hypothetical protein
LKKEAEKFRDRENELLDVRENFELVSIEIKMLDLKTGQTRH